MALVTADLKPNGTMLQTSRGATVVASDRGVQHFPANLPISRGDLLGVVLYPGATVGARDPTGATTAQFEPALRGHRTPMTVGPRRELLVRADYVPGASPVLPRQINGAQAAAAPAGRVLRSWTLKVPAVTIRLIELPTGVAFDEFAAGARVARVYIDDATPGGKDIGTNAYVVPGSPEAEADIDWLNPDGIESAHYFGVLPRSFQFYS
jgi:hypothetical protein